MRWGYKLVTLLIFMFNFSNSLSQDNKFYDLLNSEMSDESMSDMIEYLEYLEAHPIDLNNSNINEIMNVPGMDLSTARKLLSVAKSKTIQNQNDIVNNLNDLEKNKITKLLSLFKFPNSDEFNIDIRQRIKMRIQESRGFAEKIYFGNKYKNYTRLKFRDNKSLSGGFVIEKDAGETKLLDHYSGYMKYHSLNTKHTVLAGNYNLDFGRGIVFSKSSFFSNSSDPSSTFKYNNRGVIGNTSSSEYGRLSGIYYQFTNGNKKYHIFGSNTLIDVRLLDNDVTSIDKTGYHRTQTEVDHENKLREIVLGFRIEFQPNIDENFGVNVKYSKYNRSFFNKKPLEFPYAFTGNKNALLSFDYNKYIGSSNLFADIGLNEGRGIGAVLGYKMSYRAFDYGVHIRSYSGEFYSTNGNPYQSNSSNKLNESGLYLYMQKNITKQFKVNLLTDISNDKKRNSSSHFPDNNYRNVLNANYSSKKFDLWFQYKNRNEFIKNEGSNYSKFLNNTLKVQLKSYLVNNLESVSKIDFIKRIKSGYSVTQKFKSTIRQSAFYLGGTYFNTPDNSQYIYENDLNGVFTINQFKGKGHRGFFIIRANTNKLKISVKYGFTKYYDRDQISSGYNLIKGNKVSDVSLQIEYYLK